MQPPLPSSSYDAVVVTCARPQGLSECLRSLEAQSIRPRRVIVVDNAATSAPAAVGPSPVDIEYVPLSENRGFSGGLELAVEHALADPHCDGWLMVLNDDLPLPSSEFGRMSLEAAERMAALDPALAAVGRAGGDVDFTRGRLQKWRNRRYGFNPSVIPVDFVATGYGPLFRVPVLREFGNFRGELFIGMTEVEFGLRLRKAGYSLYAIRTLPDFDSSRRDDEGPRGLGSVWRDYYSRRNFTVILRENGTWWQVARFAVVSGLLRPLAKSVVTRDPRAVPRLRMNVRGVLDGLRNRLGPVIQPEFRSLDDGAADELHAPGTTSRKAAPHVDRPMQPAKRA